MNQEIEKSCITCRFSSDNKCINSPDKACVYPMLESWEPIEFKHNCDNCDRKHSDFCYGCFNNKDRPKFKPIDEIKIKNNNTEEKNIDCCLQDDFKRLSSTHTSDDINNGGKTDYYQIKKEWEQLQDVIEEREMNFAQGNMLKVVWCFGVGRHESASYERDLNKNIWFSKRELERIKNEKR